MLDGTVFPCPVRCRPIMKLFVSRTKRFRRSPDDKPFALCVGHKAGGVMVIRRFGTKREAAKMLRATLDWLDTPPGQDAYRKAIWTIATRVLNKPPDGNAATEGTP